MCKDLLKISNRKNAEYIGGFQSIRKCRVEEGSIKDTTKNPTGIFSLYMAVNDKIAVMFQLLSLKVKKGCIEIKPHVIDY